MAKQIEKDPNKLIDDAIKNINLDREMASELLYDLKQDIIAGKTTNAQSGQALSKFVETMQRSNEQLVKIIDIMKKEKPKSESLTKDDYDGLYDEMPK